jgi:methylated-DNA-protein-cysteine methyltransferase-like protein
MVGWAMNASHGLADVPAHRVVNRQGLLTGKMHFNPPDVMQKKLEEEGITVMNDQIQRFEQHFWNPSLAIQIE